MIAKDAVVVRVLPHNKVAYGVGVHGPGAYLICSPQDADTFEEQGIAERVPTSEWSKLVQRVK